MRISPKVIFSCRDIGDRTCRFRWITVPYACIRCAPRLIEGQGRQPRSGKLDPDRVLWRALSHHTPGNDAECEQKSKYPVAWYPPFSGRVKHGPSRECGKEAAGAAIPVRRVLPAHSLIAIV